MSYDIEMDQSYKEQVLQFADLAVVNTYSDVGDAVREAEFVLRKFSEDPDNTPMLMLPPMFNPYLFVYFPKFQANAYEQLRLASNTDAYVNPSYSLLLDKHLIGHFKWAAGCHTGIFYQEDDGYKELQVFGPAVVAGDHGMYQWLQKMGNGEMEQWRNTTTRNLNLLLERTHPIRTPIPVYSADINVIAIHMPARTAGSLTHKIFMDLGAAVHPFHKDGKPFSLYLLSRDQNALALAQQKRNLDTLGTISRAWIDHYTECPPAPPGFIEAQMQYCNEINPMNIYFPDY